MFAHIQNVPKGLESELWRRELNRALRITRAFGAGTAVRLRRIFAAMALMEKDPKKRVKVPQPTRTMKRICPALFRAAERREPRPFVQAKTVAHLVDSRKQHYVRLSNGQITRAFHAIVGGPEARLHPKPPAIRSQAIPATSLPTLNFPRA